jgi:hypothetical protein
MAPELPIGQQQIAKESLQGRTAHQRACHTHDVPRPEWQAVPGDFCRRPRDSRSRTARRFPGSVHATVAPVCRVHESSLSCARSHLHHLSTKFRPVASTRLSAPVPWTARIVLYIHNYSAAAKVLRSRDPYPGAQAACNPCARSASSFRILSEATIRQLRNIGLCFGVSEECRLRKSAIMDWCSQTSSPNGPTI